MLAVHSHEVESGRRRVTALVASVPLHREGSGGPEAVAERADFAAGGVEHIHVECAGALEGELESSGSVRWMCACAAELDSGGSEGIDA